MNPMVDPMPMKYNKVKSIPSAAYVVPPCGILRFNGAVCFWIAF